MNSADLKSIEESGGSQLERSVGIDHPPSENSQNVSENASLSQPKVKPSEGQQRYSLRRPRVKEEEKDKSRILPGEELSQDISGKKGPFNPAKQIKWAEKARREAIASLGLAKKESLENDLMRIMSGYLAKEIIPEEKTE